MQAESQGIEFQTQYEMVMSMAALMEGDGQDTPPIPADRHGLLVYIAAQARQLDQADFSELLDSAVDLTNSTQETVFLGEVYKKLLPLWDKPEMQGLQDTCAELWHDHLKELALLSTAFWGGSTLYHSSSDRFALVQDVASVQVYGHVWFQAAEKHTETIGFVYRIWEEGQETQHYLSGTVHGSTGTMMRNPALLEAIDSVSTVTFEVENCVEYGLSKGDAAGSGAPYSMEQEIGARAQSTGKEIGGLRSIKGHLAWLGVPEASHEETLQRTKVIADQITFSDRPFIYRSQIGAMRLLSAHIDGDKEAVIEEGRRFRNALTAEQWEMAFDYCNEQWLPRLVELFQSETPQGVFVGVCHLFLDEKPLLLLLKQAGFSYKRVWPDYAKKSVEG